MVNDQPDSTIRAVVDACSDCDICRFLMDESCLLFPELYRLYDQASDAGRSVDARALRQLAELCTLCGLCPCLNIRSDVIRSKIERTQTEGVALDVRLLADVQQFGRWAGLAPRAVNSLFSFWPIRQAIKKIAGIHPERDLPPLADESFFTWAHKHGLDREANHAPKIAYFAGCTAGYFFPNVATSTVGVLQRNGVCVHVPPQQCCGMPTLLEGDERTTLKRVRSNLKNLLNTLQNGYKLVCSCPTCGFLMKTLLKEGAYYSQAYQNAVNAGESEIVVPGQRSGNTGLVHLNKSIYSKILKDDGHFSSLDPLERITLADNIMDLGNYLGRLGRQGQLNVRLGELGGRMVYYAPCHQREQGIGSPYLDLLATVPGLTVEQVGDTMDCCGMGGSRGFKKDYHDASTRLATPLIRKIQAADPQAIITNCLSCRLQFQHLLPYPVYHPAEILLRSYETYE